MKLTQKQLLLQWDRYKTNLEKDSPVDLSESITARQARVKRLMQRGNEIEFMKYYFPHFCKSEFGRFHKKAIRKICDNPTLFATFPWSRDHAKSSLFVMLVVMLYLKKELKNFLLVSYNADNAVDLLQPIKKQLESNERLINDFGVLRGVVQWESHKFVTNDGASFRAIGSGQNPRGTREEEARPDFVLVDDIDDDEKCRNPKRMDDAFDWMMGALFGCLSIEGAKRFVVVGNIIAKDTLVLRAIKVSDFNLQVNILRKHKEVDTVLLKRLESELRNETDAHRIKILQESIRYVKALWEPTWKERFDITEAVYMIDKMGYRLSQREYFSNPLTEGKTFQKDWLTFGKVPPLSRIRHMVAYLDPGFKKTKTADTKSWVLIGLEAGKYYIIKAFCGNATVNEMIDWGYEIDAYLKRSRSAAPMYMEEVFLQDLLYKDFNAVAEKKYPLSLHGDKRKKPDKDSRIEATSGHFERGNVIFNEAEADNHHMQTLMEQYLAFEPGVKTPKDGPDAVEGGMYLLNKKVSLNNTLDVGTNRKNSKRI